MKVGTEGPKIANIESFFRASEKKGKTRSKQEKTIIGVRGESQGILQGNKIGNKFRLLSEKLKKGG